MLPTITTAHRIGAPLVGVRPIQPDLRYTQPADAALSCPERASFSRRALAHLKAPEATGSSFARDWSAVANYARMFAQLANYLQEHTHHLPRLHADQLSKAVLENGASPGWWMNGDPIYRGRLGAVHDPALLRHVRDEIRGSAGARPKRLAYVRGTNHGWPTWNNSLEDLAWHVLMASEVAARPTMTPQGAADMIGAELGEVCGPACATLWSRTGPMKKYQAAWHEQGAIYAASVETVGCYPRRRLVYGMPTWLNALLRLTSLAAYSRLKGFLGPLVDHGRPDQKLEVLRSFAREVDCDIFSTDISAMDANSSRGLQLGEWTLYEQDCPHPHLAAFYEWMLTLPTLAPPVETGAEAAYIKRDTGNPSGSSFTSLGNTWRNLLIACEAVAASCGDGGPKDAKEAFDGLSGRSSKRWQVHVLGDDALFLVPVAWRVDRELFEKRYADFDLTVKVGEEPVFLMTYYNLRKGSWHGLASRALARTVFRERSPSSELIERLGCYVRWARVRADPFAQICWDGLEGHRYVSWIKEEPLDGYLRREGPLLGPLTEQLSREGGGQEELSQLLLSITHGGGDRDEDSLAYIRTMLGVDRVDELLARRFSTPDQLSQIQSDRRRLLSIIRKPKEVPIADIFEEEESKNENA